MSSGAVTTLAARIAVRARSPVGVGLAGKFAEGLALCLFITVLPRALGPADFGRLALAVAVVQIAGASMSFGGPVTLSRFVPVQRGAERAAVARLLVTRMAGWRALLLLAAAVVAVGFAIAEPERVPAGLAALLLLAIALDSTATLLAQASLGLGISALWSYRLPVQTSLLVVAALCLVPPFGAWGAAAAVAAAAAVTALVAVVIVMPVLLRVRPAERLPPGVGRFAAIQGLNGFLALCVARGGIVAVAWLHPSASEVGYIGLATGIALGGVYAVGQAFTLQLPGLSVLAAADLPAAEARARRLARAGVLAVAPGTVAIAALVPFVLVPIIGHRYEPAVGAVIIGMAMIPMAPVSALVAQTAALRLRPQVALAALTAGATVFTAVALTAVDPFGAAGAAAAMTAGAAATALTGAALLRDAVPLRLLAVAVAGALAIAALGFTA